MPPTGRSSWPAQAGIGHGGAVRRRSSGPGPAGSPGCSPACALADLQSEPVNLCAGQVPVPLIEVVARVRGRLMRLEGRPVAVQLIEDPLQRLAVHQVGGVYERPRLVGPDGFDGLGYQPVVGLGAGLVLTCETDAQTEHDPSKSLTPCSHSLCWGGTTDITYL